MKKLLILGAILISQSVVAMDIDSVDGREITSAAYAQCIETLINEYNADAELSVPICKCMVNEIVENMSQSEIYELRNGDKAVMNKYRDLREKSSVKCREPFNNLLQKGKK